MGQNHLYIYSQIGVLSVSVAKRVSLEMPVPSQGHYGFHSFPVDRIVHGTKPSIMFFQTLFPLYC
jgi:hypothetical protein